MTSSARSQELELLHALADPAQRETAARRLARSVDAQHLFVLVVPVEFEGTLMSAPGFEEADTATEGWDELLARNRPRIVRGFVRLSDPRAAVPAVARTDPGITLVFAGGAPDPARIDRLPPFDLLGRLLAIERAEANAAARAELAEKTAEEAAELAAAFHGAHAELERTARHVRHLQEATAQLSTALTLDDVAQVLLQVCDDLVGSDSGAVYLADEDGRLRLASVRRPCRPPERFSELDLQDPTPLARAARQRQSVWLETFEELAAEFPEVTRASIAEAQPQALAAVPLIHGQRLVGALALSFTTPHRFDPDTRAWIEALATQCAVAAERARLYEAEQAARLQLRTVSDALPTLVALLGSDARYRFVSRTYQRWFGLRPEDVIGKSPRDLYGDEAFAVLRPWIERALRGEEVIRTQLHVPFRQGARELDIRLIPVAEASRDTPGFVVLADDVSERIRREKKERVLAQVMAVLLDPLDLPKTLHCIAKLVVPELADWCVLHVADEPTPLRVIAHADPDKEGLAKEIHRRWPPAEGDSGGAVRVTETGASELVTSITEDMLARFARDRDHLEALRSIGLQSYLCVPLRARGSTVGALTLASSTPGRTFDQADLALAQELGDRAALGVLNAWGQRGSQRRVAE